MGDKNENPHRALRIYASQRDSMRRDFGARQSRTAAVSPPGILRMLQVQLGLFSLYVIYAESEQAHTLTSTTH